MERLFDDILRIDAAKGGDSVFETCSEICRRMGFAQSFYGCRIPVAGEHPHQFTHDNYPSGWMQHYLEKKYYETDPLVSHSLSSIVPVRWNDERFNQNIVARNMRNESREFGIGQGISFPVHGAGGEVALISLAVDENEPESFWSPERLAPIALIASAWHEAAVKEEKKITRKKVAETIELTMREREVLKWGMISKTNFEIGVILGIGERSVRFHWENISRKFGVRGKNATIACAINMKFLD